MSPTTIHIRMLMVSPYERVRSTGSNVRARCGGRNPRRHGDVGTSRNGTSGWLPSDDESPSPRSGTMDEQVAADERRGAGGTSGGVPMFLLGVGMASAGAYFLTSRVVVQTGGYRFWG